MCDTVLVRKHGEEYTTLKLPFGIHMEHILAPHEDRVLLVYGMNEGNTLVRNFLVIVDLNNMNIVTPLTQELSDEYFQEPKWPIAESQWLDNNSILIKVPVTDTSDWDTLVEWMNDEMILSKEVIIKLMN